MNTADWLKATLVMVEYGHGTAGSVALESERNLLYSIQLCTLGFRGRARRAATHLYERQYMKLEEV